MSKNKDFVISIFDKYGRKLLDTGAETRLDARKIISKKVAHKTAEATGNKTAEKLWNFLMIQRVKNDFEEIKKEKKERSIEWIKGSMTLCDYEDAYIIVKRTIDLLAAAAN